MNILLLYYEFACNAVSNEMNNGILVEFKDKISELTEVLYGRNRGAKANKEYRYQPWSLRTVQHLLHAGM